MSNFSGVTKAWLYNQPAIKEKIENLRGTTNNRFMRDQAVQLSLKNKEIDILTKQNKHLRQQITEFMKQLEVAYSVVYKQDN